MAQVRQSTAPQLVILCVPCSSKLSGSNRAPATHADTNHTAAMRAHLPHSEDLARLH